MANTTVNLMGDGYPAVWIRLKTHVGVRLSEWSMAAHMTAWGAVLLLPAQTFTGDSWVIFRSLATEFAWGTLIMLMGMVRLISLYINGSRPNLTPWVRVTAAGFGFLLWVGVSTAFALSGVISTWMAVYPIFAAVEMVNFVRSMSDTEGKSKNGNGSS